MINHKNTWNNIANTMTPTNKTEKRDKSKVNEFTNEIQSSAEKVTVSVYEFRRDAAGVPPVVVPLVAKVRHL